MKALTIFKQKDLPAETKLKEIPPDEQAILDCIARTKKFVTQRALVTAGASAIPRSPSAWFYAYVYRGISYVLPHKYY